MVQPVTELWYQNFTHQEVLTILKGREFPELEDWSLKDLRLRHRLLYPTQGEAHHHTQALAEEYVRKHLESGQAVRYGIIYTHTNVRLAEDTFISQHQIHQALHTIHPIGVKARTNQVHRQRGRFIVKGPNRVWSVDGHDKLSDFGFELYRFNDAYSRYILGVYVGVSNRTAVSV